MTEQTLRIFVSSPGDVPDERRRVDLVVERLNAEFEGRVNLVVVRWETSFYSAHDTFQGQIPEAAECDVVIAIFRARLGTTLPPQFPRLPNGEPYPSGTAYEVLSAIDARKHGKGVPDIYVFRHPKAPAVALDAPDRAEVEAQWERLKTFFDTWFRTQGGEFIAAFQEFSTTDEFAGMVEECLRQWLERRGFAAEGPVWDRTLRGSPFPGLAAFEADRGAVFFGRDLAIAQAVERLRRAGAPGGGRAPFLLIIGASGSGKSSLLRAGLLPRLTLPGTIPEIDLWRRAVVMPGQEPFAALAECLFADEALGPELREGMFRTKELLARQLAGDLETALAPIRDALEKAAEARRLEAGFDQPRPARLALGIDQAERLLVEIEPRVAEDFAALIAAMARQGLAYVVMALRSDAYARFQGMEALVELRKTGATFDLVPPAAAELEEIVSRPVAACKPPLAFEWQIGLSLASTLVADAKGGDALPLLQMTLSRLYAAEEARGDGVLRFADYRGMDAAVTETANEALDTLAADARAELPALVTGLVRDVAADPLTGAPVPIIASLDRAHFEANAPARKALIDAFVAKRLLTSGGDGESERVRPVHEALLRIWPQAQAIVAETASLIRVRHTLEPIVREWQESAEASKAGHLEISPALLGGALQLAARFHDDLPEPMRAFITQAALIDAAKRDREREEQERRIRDAEALAGANRRIARRTLIGLAAAVVLAVLAGWQWYRADIERRGAEIATQKALEQQKRAEHNLTLATQTANGLIFDISQKFEHLGLPTSVLREILEQALKLQEQLITDGETSPELSSSQIAALDEIAYAFLHLGDTDRALELARRAEAMVNKLLAAEPDNVSWVRSQAVIEDLIGELLKARGLADEALAAYRLALAANEKLAKAEPQNDDWRGAQALGHDRIGDLLYAQTKYEEALAEYRQSFDIRTALVAKSPNNEKWRRDLSVSDSKLGDVLLSLNKVEEALATYRDGLNLVKALLDKEPDNTQYKADLLIADSKLGDVLLTQRHLDEALGYYRDAYNLAKELTRLDPDNTLWQRYQSISIREVGDALDAQGHRDEALAAYRECQMIAKALSLKDVNNAQWQVDLSVADARLGDLLYKMRQLPEALVAYRDQAAVLKALIRKYPGHSEWQRSLSFALNSIGDVLVDQQHVDLALQSYKEALAVRRALLKEAPGDIQRQIDVIYDLYKVGKSGEDPAGNFKEALDMLKILETAGKLTPEAKRWQGIITRLNAALTPK